ncbi:hypothetical protein [Amycolatopsis echigonensis]|uniref:hypothetical protein n=1 Tax=Amycolatopsis echigonensis TaxID=2576905 RepID=UPI001FC9CACA|nr:hypothetical protein [Amycolatopsis niigatensis]
MLVFQEIGCTLSEIGRHRAALEHGRHCPASDPLKCPRFWSIAEERRRGLSLAESHERAHHTKTP